MATKTRRTQREQTKIAEMEQDGSEVVHHAGEIAHYSLMAPGGLSGGDSTSASISNLYRWWKKRSIKP